MAKKWNKMVNKAVLMLLTWLGIGSASVLFMACYGTYPGDYQVIEEGDSLVVTMGDSVTMSVDLASNEKAEVADSLEVSE